MQVKAAGWRRIGLGRSSPFVRIACTSDIFICNDGNEFLSPSKTSRLSDGSLRVTRQIISTVMKHGRDSTSVFLSSRIQINEAEHAHLALRCLTLTSGDTTMHGSMMSQARLVPLRVASTSRRGNNRKILCVIDASSCFATC